MMGSSGKQGGQDLRAAQSAVLKAIRLRLGQTRQHFEVLHSQVLTVNIDVTSLPVIKSVQPTI